MTDLEWKILDEVYLMISYEEILKNVQADKNEFDSTLAKLLERGWLRQYFYDNELKDFEELDQYDVKRLSEAQYVISKKGLMAHTGSDA